MGDSFRFTLVVAETIMMIANLMQGKAKQSKRSLDEGAGRSLYALQIK